MLKNTNVNLAHSQVVPVWTTASVTVGSTAGAVPEFIRLPRPGTLCPFTGLSRSKMNELILACPANNFRPPVKSVSLRKRGQTKAVRLVCYESLRAYLHKLLEEQTEEVAADQ